MCPIVRALCPLLSVLVLPLATPSQAGTPIKGAVYVAELQTERLYRVEFRWDGMGSLQTATPELITTTNAGGGMVLAGDLIYVVGSGIVSRVDLRTRQVDAVQTFNNANACGIDPGGQHLYCGWRQGLSRVPLMPFSNGSLVALSGSDLDLTGVLFAPSGAAFYSTGTEAFNGDFGSIDLAGGTTARRQTGAFATGLSWDDFSQKILIAGLGRARLVDPASPTVVASQRDDSANENYLSLNATGFGHAVGTRCCISGANLVLLDYSASGSLAEPTTLIASVALTGLSNLSGEAEFDNDRLLRSSFEDGEF